MDSLQLHRLLREQMPLAAAMDVRVLRADDAVVELVSSLKANHNHLGSAFGGSLSSLMILASYCRLFQMINGTGHVLLKSHAAEFLRPVNEDLRAICYAPSLETRQQFLNAYLKKGKARLSLESQIVLKDGAVACRMTGEFVGQAK